MNFCCRRASHPVNISKEPILKAEANSEVTPDLGEECKQDERLTNSTSIDLDPHLEPPSSSTDPSRSMEDQSTSMCTENLEAQPEEPSDKSEELAGHRIADRIGILEKLKDEYKKPRSKILRHHPFCQLPDEWQRDREVAFAAVDLDSVGRVLQFIPLEDNEGKPLREDREMVLQAVRKAGTNLAYVRSDLIKNDATVAFAAITQTPRACKYIGDELKRDKAFIMEMLEKLAPFKKSITYRESTTRTFEEPKRQKVNKYFYAVPKNWPGNFGAGYSDPEFGDGEQELPFGTDIGEALEEKEVEIVTLDNFPGQSEIVEAIDESLLHDADVKNALFEVDCVALLFFDITRREMLADPSSLTPSSKPMRQNWKRIVDEWHTYYRPLYELEETLHGEVKRLMCWPTKFWKPSEDTPPIAIADNILFWIECIRRTENRALLAEAPKDILIDEDKMLEAIKIDKELFRITPWKLRVSDSFKAKLSTEMEGCFLWITLEDQRAEIPSKARDSEMGEMIAAFAAVQKAKSLQQHQVPFLQLISSAVPLQRLKTYG